MDKSELLEKYKGYAPSMPVDEMGQNLVTNLGKPKSLKTIENIINNHLVSEEDGVYWRNVLFAVTHTNYRRMSDILQEEYDSCDNDLTAMGIYPKIQRWKRVEFFLDELLIPLEEMFMVHEFNTNSYRIVCGKNKVDFFPPSGKLFDYSTKKWLEFKHTNEWEKEIIKRLR